MQIVNYREGSAEIKQRTIKKNTTRDCSIVPIFYDYQKRRSLLGECVMDSSPHSCDLDRSIKGTSLKLNKRKARKHTRASVWRENFKSVSIRGRQKVFGTIILAAKGS